MEEGKSGETEPRTVLRRNALRDINYLLSKTWVTEKEVYDLIKLFLKGFLNINYEFTKDELFDELKNVYLPYTVRSDFFKFVDEVFLFEYSSVKYSDEELKDILKEFKGYLDYLLTPNFVEKSVSGTVFSDMRKKAAGVLRTVLAKQMKDFKPKAKPVEKKEAKEEPKSVVVLDSVSSAHVDINSLIEKIYLSLDNNDIDSAKLLYKDAMSKYQFLSPDEKSYYYESLLSVYNSLTKSA